MSVKASPDLLTADIKQLQTLLTQSIISSVDLVHLYLNQISNHDPHLHAMIWTSPAQPVFDFAETLDKERESGKLRGPLHGIPFVVKDSIATHPDLGYGTTAGSLALLKARPPKSAKVVEQLIQAGGILVGKANLSELANFKGTNLTSGWSPIGGQTQSAYVRGGVNPDDGKDGHSNPSGSSSGSAVAVSAGYAPFALGTETDGSLVIPAGRASLYTIKPTIGLLSGEGICPVSHNFDSPGPMAKTAYDIAVIMDVLVDSETKSRGGKSYTESLTESWADISVGALSPEVWKLPDEWVRPVPAATKEMNKKFRMAYSTIKSHAKYFVADVDMITTDAFMLDGENSQSMVTQADFVPDLGKYLEWLEYSPIKNLEELIQFNLDHAVEELPPDHNNQDTLLACRDMNLSKEQYHKHLNHLRLIGRTKGIDHVLDTHGLDVIIGPADSLMCSFASASGYPIAAMPLGYLDYNGRAFGVTALARANDEALLIKVMSAWEKTFGPRKAPQLDRKAA